MVDWQRIEKYQNNLIATLQRNMYMYLCAVQVKVTLSALALFDKQVPAL